VVAVAALMPDLWPARRGSAPARPRLTRHVLHLERGNRVQVSVAGRGVPLVLVHGYTAEGFLYAQSLSRLVASGFRVVAIDAAGHGGTEGLEEGGADLQYYAGLLGRVVDHLGIEQAVFAGHSMGGRLVTELVARQPRRGIAVVLIDAIVGDTWDGLVQLWRLVPGLMGMTGAALALDTATTVPLLRDPRQALKLSRLWVPVALHNLRRPGGLVGAAVSILRSGPTRWMLDRLAEEGVPVVVVHGDRDVAVPLRTGEDAARRTGGELVVVHGATHAWPLKDPETLPAIVNELLAHGSLGPAVGAAVRAAGLDPARASLTDVEAALCRPGARLPTLDPEAGEEAFVAHSPRRPRYKWTRHRPEGAAPR
jgi:pimeloyl-ACP methyl ester carboxylesterase